jgi:RHS repeat-associated protein
MARIEIRAGMVLEAVRSRYTGKERDSESGLDYFGARYYGSTMGRFMSPDWSAKYEPVPYAKLDNPQSLNLYSYVYNNPLSRADRDGHGVWDLAKAWLNVVEVKVGASAGVGTSFQWGVAKGEAHATLIGVEGKTGLGGGGADAKITSGIGTSGSAGPAKVGISAGGEVSVKDGASASAGANASLGAAQAPASASVDSSGGHTSASATIAGPDEVKEDSKVAGSLTIGATLGAGINLTQAGRAWDMTVQNGQAIGAYLNTLLPSNPMAGSPVLPTPTQ